MNKKEKYISKCYNKIRVSGFLLLIGICMGCSKSLPDNFNKKLAESFFLNHIWVANYNGLNDTLNIYIGNDGKLHNRNSTWNLLGGTTELRNEIKVNRYVNPTTGNVTYFADIYLSISDSNKTHKVVAKFCTDGVDCNFTRLKCVFNDSLGRDTIFEFIKINNSIYKQK